MKKRAFLYLSLSAAVLGCLVSGFSTFGPKFIESQFGESASTASKLFGKLYVFANAIMTSSYHKKWCKPFRLDEIQ